MKKKVMNFRINLPYLMHLTFLTVMLLAIIPSVANAQSGKANFSGNWTFNESKSNMGDTGGRRFGRGDMVVKQDANTLTIERTRTNRDGQTMNMTSKYSLDGKETTNSFGRGESKSTAKWSSDGKSLTITTTFSFNGNERTSTEVWTFTNANTLSVASTRQGRNGEMKTTRVYDKK